MINLLPCTTKGFTSPINWFVWFFPGRAQIQLVVGKVLGVVGSPYSFSLSFTGKGIWGEIHHTRLAQQVGELVICYPLSLSLSLSFVALRSYERKRDNEGRGIIT